MEGPSLSVLEQNRTLVECPSNIYSIFSLKIDMQICKQWCQSFQKEASISIAHFIVYAVNLQQQGFSALSSYIYW